MTFKDDLSEKVDEFVKEAWDAIPDGIVVPSPTDLTFGNTGRRLNACIFYADIHRSTEMVNTLVDTMAAEYYKAFLHCAAKIIKRNGGEITAYDGDRVMAVFLGEKKEDDSVITALELSFVVNNIVNPKFSDQYKAEHRKLKHTVGIDVSDVLVSKTGVRIDSDLVWIGASANYAAKLNSFDGLDSDYPIRITHEVYSALSNGWIKDKSGNSMWQGPYTDFDPRRHYRSNFHLPFE